MAIQVSVATWARSSRWLPRLVRRKVESGRAQRPRLSQLVRRPLSPMPRTSTWISVFRGVLAVQDGTTSVAANPGRTHREVQLPAR